MDQPIIEIKKLSKKYDITHQRGGGSYVALRDVLTNIIRYPFKFAKHKTRAATGKTKKEKFWALKNINLSIKKGLALNLTILVLKLTRPRLFYIALTVYLSCYKPL